MTLILPAEQEEARRSFRVFCEANVAPQAAQYDREQQIPLAHIRQLAAAGFLGAALPRRYGGAEMDAVTYGLLHEELARGSSSVEGVVNVHNMASQAILRWGQAEVRARWLPRLCSGNSLAAFAVTEADVGSDAKSVQATAVLRGAEYVLSGRKKWITSGQVADVFVVLVQCDGEPTAFLVERSQSDLSTVPISGLIGCRGYMLAEVTLADCRVPRENLLGRIGFGLSHVVATGLDAGRYALAWGCVGIGQSCLEASLRYATQRLQGGVPLGGHQLIQRKISRMVTGVRAARLLCWQAGCLRDARDPGATMAAAVAKYFASTLLGRVARDAVQIHGANGCSDAYPVERHLRDSTIMEIIEGTTEIQELIIAQHAYREAR